MDDLLSFSVVDLSDLTEGMSCEMYDGCQNNHGRCGKGCGCGGSKGECGGWIDTKSQIGSH